MKNKARRNAFLRCFSGESSSPVGPVSSLFFFCSLFFLSFFRPPHAVLFVGWDREGAGQPGAAEGLRLHFSHSRVVAVVSSTIFISARLYYSSSCSPLFCCRCSLFCLHAALVHALSLSLCHLRAQSWSPLSVLSSHFIPTNTAQHLKKTSQLV
jgi:hypothetical protein